MLLMCIVALYSLDVDACAAATTPAERFAGGCLMHGEPQAAAATGRAATMSAELKVCVEYVSLAFCLDNLLL